MTFSFAVATAGGATPISVEAGSSVIFVGSNGAGKTRLAVSIESQLQQRAHRVAAHRALTLNTDVPKVSEKLALNGLRFGHAAQDAHAGHRDGMRWGKKHAVNLLNDFDYVVQALFAEQSNTALKTHKSARSGATGTPELTKFEKLQRIWERLLPARRLIISGDSVQVAALGGGDEYSASEMSDGERAVFYVLGQALVAAADSALIVDEPELHMHPSIMSALWDEIEAARMDCCFIFITHDLEFAASRIAQKFVIRDYKDGPQWTLEPVPADSGFSEEVATLILGSRRPVLFVEGTSTSMDIAFYRACYPGWTVIPKGSCEEVIHSVTTMRSNASLTRVTCAGVVDADSRDSTELAFLSGLGIAVLPVSEIESLVLLPPISEQIAISEGYTGDALAAKMQELKTAVLQTLVSEKAKDDVVVRHCKRRIDRQLKRIDLSAAATVVELVAEYSSKSQALDVASVAASARKRIDDAIFAQDLRALLACYDNKGLLAVAAGCLRATKKDAFEEWLVRSLGSGNQPALVGALRAQLPVIQAR